MPDPLKYGIDFDEGEFNWSSHYLEIEVVGDG